MILITGFKPFLNESINPSELLLDELKGLPKVETLVLPVEYDGAFNNLRVHLAQKFKIILLLGQAGGAFKVRLERVALNLEDSQSPDQAGVVRSGHLIEVSGPPAIFSSLPLSQWSHQSPHMEVSNHAGTYVCNSLYYKTLRHVPTPTLFVHLPYLPEQVSMKAPGTPFLEFLEMKKIILDLIQKIQ